MRRERQVHGAVPAAEDMMPSGDTSSDRLYTGRFFQISAAAWLFMVGVSMQFHFGQYVAFLGYGVDTLGRILSLSMVATLLSRLRIGRWIDRFGFRPTWLLGSVVAGSAMGVMPFVSQLWLVVLLRMAAVIAAAAVMTSVAVYAAVIAPPHRRAESIGSMGLAGFLGMIVGPALGDLIFHASAESIVPYRVFFLTTAGCSLAAGFIAMTVRLPAGAPAAAPAMSSSAKPAAQWRIIVAHWPGAVLLVGVTFGMVYCLQSSFLERFADARGFHDIKVFFAVYCPTAIVLRLVFRRLPERMGRTRTLLLGLTTLALGIVFLTQVQTQIGLVLPGLFMGAGHCFIFPSMVDLAAERLPAEHRGTGTSLILGCGDLGLLIGFGVLGEVIEAQGYTAALLLLSGIVVATAIFLTVSRRDDIFHHKARQTELVRREPGEPANVLAPNAPLRPSLCLGQGHEIERTSTLQS